MGDRATVRGFGALASLASDVSRELALADQIAKSAESAQDERGRGHEAGATKDGTQGGEAPFIGAHRAPSSRGFRVPMALIGGGVLVAMIIVALSNSPNPPSSTPLKGGSTASAVPSEPVPGALAVPPSEGTASTDNGSSALTTTPPAPPVVPKEEEPPPAKSLPLTLPELRWCMSESIRLKAMKPLLDGTDDAQITAYNRFVERFNGRCVGAHYYKEDRATVERELAQEGGRLQREALERLKR